MGDLGDVYTQLRLDISTLLGTLSPEDLARQVPATPGWTIKDVAGHLAADATCTIAGDYPKAFFMNFGAPDAVIELNSWTDRQIQERKDVPIEDVLQEWEKSAITLTAMIRGETPWPEELLFADRAMITDATVHQHDLFGALGIESDRNSVGVRLGSAGYIAMVDMRLRQAGGGCLRFEAEEKVWNAGDGEPDATVRATRFEFFRALSGRRSPEQVRAYDWTGDPDPFIAYFYPYGIRAEPLHE